MGRAAGRAGGSPRGCVRAVAVHAGAAEAAVGLGLAVRVVEALGAHAAEAVHLVDARAPVVARAGRALVDVHVAPGPWRGKRHFLSCTAYKSPLCKSTRRDTAQGSQGSSTELTCLRALTQAKRSVSERCSTLLCLENSTDTQQVFTNHSRIPTKITS